MNLPSFTVKKIFVFLTIDHGSDLWLQELEDIISYRENVDES